MSRSCEQSHIGVIGVGVLGSVVSRYFEGRGHEVSVYDKFQKLGSMADVNQADVVFVCVPTPYKDTHGFDLSAVEASIEALSGSRTVVIKSTVLPGTSERLQQQFPQHGVFFQPEFLREKTAWEDFIKPDRQIVGYCGENAHAARDLLGLLPAAPYEAVMPATAAELVKMAGNAFLAMKVTFANQLFDLCGRLDTDYDLVKSGLAADPRIGASHMEVHDSGYRGYGGKCLPKDTQGLIDLAEAAGAPMELLRVTQAFNEQLTLEQSPVRQAA